MLSFDFYQMTAILSRTGLENCAKRRLQSGRIWISGQIPKVGMHSTLSGSDVMNRARGLPSLILE
ncbi:MAG: hypothetical protein OXC02_04465 [Rhodobacteraceae bacterium]|nr:hypothetical protein [Paracoccaceae bacterium]